MVMKKTAEEIYSNRFRESGFELFDISRKLQINTMIAFAAQEVKAAVEERDKEIFIKLQSLKYTDYDISIGINQLYALGANDRINIMLDFLQSKTKEP